MIEIIHFYPLLCRIAHRGQRAAWIIQVQRTIVAEQEWEPRCSKSWITGHSGHVAPYQLSSKLLLHDYTSAFLCWLEDLTTHFFIHLVLCNLCAFFYHGSSPSFSPSLLCYSVTFKKARRIGWIENKFCIPCQCGLREVIKKRLSWHASKAPAIIVAEISISKVKVS